MLGYRDTATANERSVAEQGFGGNNPW